MNYYETIFDTETKKFFDEISVNDPGQLGVSILSVYSRTIDENFNEIEGKMQSFWENDFQDAFKLFEKADRIVGFNSINFDIPALLPYFPSHWPKLMHFDLLDEIKKKIGKRMPLDSLARATLKSGKTDSGENAIKYWRLGDKSSLEKLKKYCEADVLITRDLYDYGLKNKSLKYVDFWNETRKINIDFSYPKENPSKKQTSLF